MESTEIAKIQKVCLKRREAGEKVYGEAHKIKNLFEEMRQEQYDVINYSIFQIDKINKAEEKYARFFTPTGDLNWEMAKDSLDR